MAELGARQLLGLLLSAAWKTCDFRHTVPSSNRLSTLRGLLRRFPHWAAGHRELAYTALDSDDVATAYGAAICYQNLAASKPKHARLALFILGRCCLRRGEWQRALSFFRAAKNYGLNTPELSEDTAAAHMLGGDYQSALAILSNLPESTLSVEGAAALKFLRSKGNQ